MEKQNLTQQKHAFTNQNKCITTQYKYKNKLKPDLVASYDIRPGNRDGVFWLRCFTNLSLTYLLRHPLTYSLGPTRGCTICRHCLAVTVTECGIIFDTYNIYKHNAVETGL